jgi:glycosyltransferase involved in cell wall biosynthesis
VRELDARESFDVLEAAELGLDGERLLQDRAFVPRMVIQCHGGNAFGQGTAGVRGLPNRLDFAWSFRRELRAFQLVPKVIVPSEATRRNLLSYGVAPGKITCVHHGIDTTRFRPPGRRTGSYPLTVGFVGRLETTKGIDFVWKVIDAIGPEAGIRFRLKGATHPAWKRDTAEKLERFASFVEHVPPGDTCEMPAFYHTLDVLLQPSRFENFGLAYAEAMASGLLVFAGQDGSGPEVVTDKITGFLVDPGGEPYDVVAQLRAMASDPSRFDRMRQAAREDVVGRFSIAQCAQRKIDTYLRPPSVS